MAEVIILRGISGAGKTHLAKELAKDARSTICSADHYMVNARGQYAFDNRRLQECHGKCFTRFLDLVTCLKWSRIIVDNTNGSLWEVSPYIQIALAYKHRVKVITLICDPAIAAQRSTHNIPHNVTVAKDLQIRKTTARMPFWWNQEVRFVRVVPRQK